MRNIEFCTNTKTLVHTMPILHCCPPMKNQIGNIDYKPMFFISLHLMKLKLKWWTIMQFKVMENVRIKTMSATLKLSDISLIVKWFSFTDYLATGTETVIMATTNYRTVIFTWIVWKKHGSSREVILSSPTEAHNSSFSKFTYVIEQHGREQAFLNLLNS